MSFTFSNILIPVDFSVNTEIAIKKALWLAVSLNPVIYLLHVLTPDVSAAGSYSHGYLFKAPVIQTEYVKFAEIRLQKIKEDIQQVFPQAGVVTKVVAADNIQMKIIEFANSIKPELIVIGKNKNHRWLPFLNTVNVSRITKQTNAAVLTVRPGALLNKMKKIVIPVGDCMPQRKIELLSALTNNRKPRIHLVTLKPKKNDYSSMSSVFLNTYRTISEYLHYPVEYKTLRGKNPAKAVFNYAKAIMADIVIVNPYEETKINSISGTQISDLILPESRLSILTALPYHNN